MYLSAWFGSCLNCLVHVVMYSYYGLSVIPSLKGKLWWKRYITRFQLVSSNTTTTATTNTSTLTTVMVTRLTTAPSPPLDNILVLVIVWGLTGNIHFFITLSRTSYSIYIKCDFSICRLFLCFSSVFRVYVVLCLPGKTRL